MINELYTSLIPHIVEHGYKLNGNSSGEYLRNSSVDASHAVISHLCNPDRYFVFLLNESFLIRKYDDNHETRENRRFVPFV